MNAIAAAAWLSCGVASAGLLMQCLNLSEYRGLRPAVSSQRATVSACIAVRNEASNIRSCLASILQQPEIGNVIVCDDRSEDDTAEIVAATAQEDARIVLISSRSGGGKRNACSAAATEAIRLGATSVFFTDADVRFDSGAIASLSNVQEQMRVAAVSAWPRLRNATFWDRLFSQTLTLFLLQALPMRAARLSRTPAIAAANGQMILVQSRAYRDCGGHARCRSVVEDVELAKLLKRAGYQVALANASRIASVSGYGTLQANVQGYGRSLYCGGGRCATAAFAIWQFVAFALPWCLLPTAPTPAGIAIASAVAARTLIAIGAKDRTPPLLETLTAGFINAAAAASFIVCRPRVSWRGRSLYY